MDKFLERYLKARSAQVEVELGRLLRRAGRAPIPFLAPMPEEIRAAMSYSLMAGGKRLRPVLVMAAAECCRLPGRKVLKAACALEMIHTYSLIHDDLPAMDDDDLRRGKPTNHKVFGEALAVLAGDGLLTLAFELAAENARALRLPGPAATELIRVIAAGAGTRGMVGGQVADLKAEGFAFPPAGNGAPAGDRRARGLLEYIHTHKTAALMAAALEAGALLAGARPAERKALRRFGQALGLAFQIHDDVLDRVGDKEKLGKRGSDLANDKLTYPRLYGVDGSKTLALRWAARARAALAPFGSRAEPLLRLADYVVSRDR